MNKRKIKSFDLIMRKHCTVKVNCNTDFAKEHNNL